MGLCVQCKAVDVAPSSARDHLSSSDKASRFTRSHLVKHTHIHVYNISTGLLWHAEKAHLGKQS